MTESEVPSEDKEQMLFVQWFRRTYPGVRVFAIPNGGARSKATAGKLKATGVSAGVPDLFIPEWRLWVEMKRSKGGVISPEQKDWMTYLNTVGYQCVVGRGCEDTKQHIVRFTQAK